MCAEDEEKDEHEGARLRPADYDDRPGRENASIGRETIFQNQDSLRVSLNDVDRLAAEMSAAGNEPSSSTLIRPARLAVVQSGWKSRRKSAAGPSRCIKLRGVRTF
jgi:hypothetical protein